MLICDITPEQRRAALAAIGEKRRDFAQKVGVAENTLGMWVRTGEVTKRVERRIIAAIESAGWKFADGGILPISPAARRKAGEAHAA